MTHILVVEDEMHLAELEKDYLSQAGFEVTLVSRGDEVSGWLAEHTADLIVLDIMLPGASGLDVCRAIRKVSQVPIIMTTAKVEEIDRLIGLELGADDYLCKPFSLRELVARAKTVLRRHHYVPGTVDSSDLSLQLPEHTNLVRRGSETVELTIVEVRLLQLLMAHPKQIFSRDQIINRIYDDRRVVSDRTVDSHIKKLRKKLSALGTDHDYVQSVYGAGYCFQPELIAEP